MNDNRTIFNIRESHMPRLEREVAKLSKKANKFAGWTFDCLVIGYHFGDNPDGSKTKFLEVCLDVDVIKIDGWQFVARIDHSPETGNILRAVPNSGIALDERFRTCDPDCEHCQYRRLRRDTFVLFNADEGFKQVGSSCLVDFLGHDAAKLGRVAELSGYALELAQAIEREPTDEPRRLQDHRYIDLPAFLAECAASIRVHGWVSANAAYQSEHLTPTRSTALSNMFGLKREIEVLDEDRAFAEKALEWAQSFRDKETLSDYEHNVAVIAESSVIDYRGTGIAASIVGVFSSRTTPKRNVQLGDMTAMISLFRNAGSRIRYPKINLAIPDMGTIVLSVAGDKAAKPGTINVKSQGNFENALWYGRINLDGSYNPTRNAPKGIENYLLEFAADPAGVASRHGHKTGQCCFCNRPLNDARSTQVGYGPNCAEKWRLPWGAVSNADQPSLF